MGSSDRQISPGPGPLRVLFYAEELDIGGANQTAVTSAVAIRERGHEVFFVSGDGPLRDRLERVGIRHTVVDTRARHPSLPLAGVLRNTIRSERINLICPNGLDCYLDALLASVMTGVPVVPTFSGICVSSYHPRLPKAIVVCGEYREDLIKQCGWRPESIELLMNRIDTDRFRPGINGEPFRKSLNIPINAPLVLMVCRQEILKIGGIHFLLDAVEALDRRVSGVQVVLVGGGSLAPQVTRRVLELNERIGRQMVIQAGTLLNMDQVFSAADVVVGNGARSALEGMACGKPAVSVGESGLAGVMSAGNIEDFAFHNFDKGRVFDSTTRRDPLLLAEQIGQLMDDPDRRSELGRFGREFVEKRLGIQAGIVRLEKLLLQASRRNAAQRAADALELSRTVLSRGMHAIRRRLGHLRRGDLARTPSPSSSHSSFLASSAMTFLTSIFSLGVGVIQAAVVARILLPAGKGALTSALLLPGLFAMLAPLGINFSAVFYLGQKKFEREQLVRTVLGAVLLLAGAGMVAAWLAGTLTGDLFLGGVPNLAFHLAVLTVPTSVGFLCLISLFRGELRFAEANLLQASWSGLFFTGILITLPLLGWGISGVILSQLVAEIVVMSFGFRRFGGVSFRPSFQWGILKKLLGYGLQVYSFSILLFLNYRFDLFVVRSMLDLRATGLYATAVSLAEMLWLLPTALSTVLFPSVASSGDVNRDRLTLAVCRNAFWIMFGICGIFALLRNQVLRIFFGDPFVPAGAALLAILPGILAMAVQRVLGAALSGRGRPLPVTLGAGLGFAVNVVLNFWWIPRFGIVGAALASSISYFVVTLVVTVAFLRISKCTFRDAFLLRREDLKRLMGIVGRVKEVMV